MGFATSDDAGVYVLTPEIALVQTVDYFTPVVDEAADFGRIAAANALSDVYAMGGKPLTALNLVGFPIGKLPGELLAAILQGGLEKVTESGAVLIGGHSIDDPEPKYGLAVTGIVHPDRVWTNAGGQPGDVLLLTKPIGSGVVTTGIKRDLVSPEEIAEVTAVMAALNRSAAEALSGFTVHACTDVTGFGLLGHLCELTCASGVTAEVYAAAVPVIPAARRLAEARAFPGGSKANARYLERWVAYADTFGEADRLLLCDANTSGGLLAALPAREAEAAAAALKQAGCLASTVIGRLTGPGEGRIRVL